MAKNDKGTTTVKLFMKGPCCSEALICVNGFGDLLEKYQHCYIPSAVGKVALCFPFPNNYDSFPSLPPLVVEQKGTGGAADSTQCLQEGWWHCTIMIPEKVLLTWM